MFLFSFESSFHFKFEATKSQNGGPEEPLELGRRRLRPVEVLSAVAILAASGGAL